MRIEIIVIIVLLSITALFSMQMFSCVDAINNAASPNNKMELVTTGECKKDFDCFGNLVSIYIGSEKLITETLSGGDKLASTYSMSGKRVGIEQMQQGKRYSLYKSEAHSLWNKHECLFINCEEVK